jgi:hypothetical protein
MRKIMLLYLAILFSSCRHGEYKFAIFDYKIKDTDYTVKIEDPAKLEILQNGISTLKQEGIKFPIEYQLTIGSKNGDTLKYWGNSCVMMDSSSRRYYIPKGKARKDFIELLKSTARGMKVDEVPW